MRVISICNLNETTEKKSKSLSYEEIKKEEGVYRRTDISPDEKIRYIVVCAPRLHSVPEVSVLYYDQFVNTLMPFNESTNKNKIFIKTDEQVYMEVK